MSRYHKNGDLPPGTPGTPRLEGDDRNVLVAIVVGENGAGTAVMPPSASLSQAITALRETANQLETRWRVAVEQFMSEYTERSQSRIVTR